MARRIVGGIKFSTWFLVIGGLIAVAYNHTVVTDLVDNLKGKFNSLTGKV